jgi:hypothetical protein
MAFVFVPNGINMAEWTPKAAGALQMTPIIQPLAELQKDISILTGLSQQNAFALGDGPGDHARSTAAWLTGVHPRKTGSRNWWKNSICFARNWMRAKRARGRL